MVLIVPDQSKNLNFQLWLDIMIIWFWTWKPYMQFALVHGRKAEAPTCLEMHSSYVSRQLTTIYTVIYS